MNVRCMSNSYMMPAEREERGCLIIAIRLQSSTFVFNLYHVFYLPSVFSSVSELDLIRHFLKDRVGRFTAYLGKQ